MTTCRAWINFLTICVNWKPSRPGTGTGNKNFYALVKLSLHHGPEKMLLSDNPDCQGWLLMHNTISGQKKKENACMVWFWLFTCTENPETIIIIMLLFLSVHFDVTVMLFVCFFWNFCYIHIYIRMVCLLISYMNVDLQVFLNHTFCMFFEYFLYFPLKLYAIARISTSFRRTAWRSKKKLNW